MSINQYDATTGRLVPLGGVPLETINSKADASDVEAIEDNLASATTKEVTGTTIAAKVHSEGDYFNLGGRFVKALDDIAVGDTLVEGTNYESTDVGSELSTIESGIAGKADQSVVSALSSALTVVDPDEGSGGIRFGVDANGNYGYKKVGADTVTPFKSDIEIKSSNATYSTTAPSYPTYYVNFPMVLPIGLMPFDFSIGEYIYLIISCTDNGIYNQPIHIRESSAGTQVSEGSGAILRQNGLHLYKLKATAKIEKTKSYYLYKSSTSATAQVTGIFIMK